MRLGLGGLVNGLPAQFWPRMYILLLRFGSGVVLGRTYSLLQSLSG